MVNEKPNPKKYRRVSKQMHSRPSARRNERRFSRNTNGHSSANTPDKRYTIGRPIINVPSSPLDPDVSEDDKNEVTKDGD